MSATERIGNERAAGRPHPERPKTGILAGKRLLVTGVVTRRSIAFGVAEGAQQRCRGRADELRPHAPADRARGGGLDRPTVLELDVNEPDLAALVDRARQRWGRVDGVLHAIAFAPPDALGGNFLATPPRERPHGVRDERRLAEGARARRCCR